MAVTLNSGIDVMRDLGFFDVVFPFILFFAGTFGVLSTVKILGDNKTINLFIALSISLTLVSFTPVISLVRQLLVLSTVFFSVVIFIVLIFSFLGLKKEDIADAAKQSESYTAIFVVMTILLIVAIVSAVPTFQDATEGTGVESNTNSQFSGKFVEGQSLSEFSPTSDPISRGVSTIFDPSILSVIVLLLIFTGAALLIGRPGK
tara:strand:+ start:49 stop:660 length:612 start_codon:yes stop_codon:yes gene_type:complete